MKTNSKSNIHKKTEIFLLITAFISGFVTMALEIIGFRIFAPYFGYSVYVSGTLIGIVMVALTIGAWFGGLLADKKGNLNTVFKWIFYSTIYLFITTITYKYVLAFFADYFIIGVILSAFVLYGFPMLVLSMVSPYFIKLIADNQNVGKAAGNIGAVGTIGAILGTIIPTFILIPYLGSFITYFISASLLLIAILVFYYKKNKWFLLSLVLLLTFFLQPTENNQNIIYETESIYNYIKVFQKESGELFLKLNDDQSYHSVYDSTKEYNENYYYYYMNVAPLINNAKTGLVLGMGAGTSPLQMIRLYNMKIDAIEIDPEVVKVAKIYFGLGDEKIKKNMNIYVDDARPFLRKTNKKYDLVEIDMYHGGLYVPFYVMTKEFFVDVKKHMNENGVIVMNVLYPKRSNEKELVFNAVANTVDSVFENVFYLNLNAFNIIVYATDEKISIDEVRNRMNKRAPKEIGIIDSITTNIKKYKSKTNAKILTDNKAPIEKLTYEMLVSV